VEVLYPAVPGSEQGLAPMEVDIRYALPESEREKVTDEVQPHQSCDCYSELPVDEDHGPYPLVLFVHGTASWRTQSLSLMEHWASRGFVVASADHPGLWLSDILGSVCGLPTSGSQDLLGDLETIRAGFSDGDESLDFLADRVDLDKLAVVGHSAGANAATSAAELEGVQVVISMAGSGSTDVPNLGTALFLGGMADSVVSFAQTESAYEQSASDRRLVGIAEGGHLVFSDICELTNDDGQDLVEIATEAGVCGTQFASFLFDCAASTIPAEDSSAIVKAASTWELEKHLHCDDSLGAFDDFGSRSPWIEVLQSAEAQSL
jgi:dienelactone hydrolase